MEVAPDYLYCLVQSVYSFLHPHRDYVTFNYVKVRHQWYGTRRAQNLPKNKWAIASPKYAHLLAEPPQPYERYFGIERGSIVIDVGAAIGQTTLQFASKVGLEGMVIAIWPYLARKICLCNQK